MNDKVMMARQPICDAQGRLFAYEVLYRSAKLAGPEGLGDTLSARSLVHSLIDIGLDELVGSRLAFINIPESILRSSAILLLPKERVVLEILETTEPTKENLERIQELTKLGYRFAYDDYTFQPEQNKFLPYVSIVKVDLMGTPSNILRSRITSLKAKGLTLLAEKVETDEVHRQCKMLGFQYFQGYYFAKPVLVPGRVALPSKVSLLRVVSRLMDIDVTIGEVQQLIEGDVSLVYRLLKLINSAALSIGRRIEDVREAIFILGVERVAALAGLLLMCAANEGSTEVINLAMVRARMCEELAIAYKFERPHQHFTVGLFSLLETIAGGPLSELLEELPISDRIASVLLGEETQSDLAKTLRWTLSYEAGEFDDAGSDTKTHRTVFQAYVNAVTWSTIARPDRAA